MRQQRGGTFLGFVLGLVVGLGAALAVAVYVTKVPVPFVNKAPSRTAEQDATEVQKNKDWNPNAPLYGKNPVKPTGPVAPAAAQVTPPSSPQTPAPAVDQPGDAKPTVSKSPANAPPSAAQQDTKPSTRPVAPADPLGDLVKSRAATSKPATAVASATASDADPFSYYVQVGAYHTPDDAESQRAKLSLAGIETKISEREQSGRTVYRVRLGPYDKREDADKVKAGLDATGGMDTALVRVRH